MRMQSERKNWILHAQTAIALPAVENQMSIALVKCKQRRPQEKGERERGSVREIQFHRKTFGVVAFASVLGYFVRFDVSSVLLPPPSPPPPQTSASQTHFTTAN